MLKRCIYKIIILNIGMNDILVIYHFGGSSDAIENLMLAYIPDIASDIPLCDIKIPHQI